MSEAPSLDRERLTMSPHPNLIRLVELKLHERKICDSAKKNLTKFEKK